MNFKLDPADPDGRTLRDLETGSRWSAWMGAAFEGELAGSQLERVVTTNVFWFGWSDYHPETGVFELGG